MAINSIPGVGPQNSDIATAVAAPSAATIASAVAAPSASTIATAVAAAVPTSAQITTIVQNNASGLKKYSQIFTSSTTWTAPTGATLVDVIACGGGGGGGGGAQTSTNANYYSLGGGGGGGQVVRGSTAVTPGTTYTVTVGAGGSGAVMSTSSLASCTAAQTGGISSFAYQYTLLNGTYNGAGEFGSADWYRYVVNNGSINAGTIASPQTSTASTAQRSGSIAVTANGWANPYYFYYSNLYPSGVSDNYAEVYTWVACNPNTAYTLSGQFMTNSNGSTVSVSANISWFTSKNGSHISTIQSGAATTPSTQTGWTQRSVSGTSPSNATYALIRMVGANPNVYGGGFRVTAVQFEPGSSVTTYKNYTTSGATVSIVYGIVQTTAGVLAAGGGGGDSDFNVGNLVGGVGWGGGGRSYSTTASRYMVAGNGWGAGSPPNNPILYPASTTLTGISNWWSPSQYGPLGGLRGTYGFEFISNHWVGQGSGGQPTAENLGAGGMGSYQGQIMQGIPGYGAANSLTAYNTGNPGASNTGAGGSGAAATASQVNAWNGGAGGSGVVIISWLGA